MEATVIRSWISPLGSGYGYGSGHGYGKGSGEGYGKGYSNGSGLDDGYIKILKHNQNAVYYIDEIATVINSIHGNYAKGYIVDNNFNAVDCYIAKNDSLGLFAHGDTLRAAYSALGDKITKRMSIDERIDLFINSFDLVSKYPVATFYRWHNLLTGSCEFGRKQFMVSHNLKFDDKITVKEFIKLCENDYGSDVISKLKEKIL